VGSWIKVLIFDLDQVVLIGLAVISPVFTAVLGSRFQSDSVGPSA
jgi:hypothetical protein